VKTEDEVEDVYAIESLIEKYNRIFGEVWNALGERISPKERQNLFDEIKNQVNEPVLEGPLFDARGHLPVTVLMANVADYPQDRRLKVLSSSLDNLMSFLLFEASKHLDSSQKDSIYKLVDNN
ncbi:MAG: hypothetical protein N2445_05610, partial [Acidobacteria bacterium]|nr:hypothetical protein [Acidobacteriota bacterium]